MGVSNQVYSLATSKSGNKAPLDGDYFTHMIVSTLENMGRSRPTRIGAHQRFDLYLTQKDYGLTYAGRATAGFPVAFPPANYSTVAAAYSDARTDTSSSSRDAFVSEHLREHELAGCGYEPDRTWTAVLDRAEQSLLSPCEDRPKDDN